MLVIADEIEAAFPAQAARLRAARIGRLVKPKAHTALNLKRAAAVVQVERLIAYGEEKAKAIEIVSNGMRLLEAVTGDACAKNQKRVNAILREWGVLPAKNIPGQ
jgi:hypothetical protein